MEEKKTNRLITEASPYLLQHAYNPVNWYPWGEEALTEARKENKILIISIGYSACHWCHVMEKETFEDLESAELMNKNFICIKIDREERPDLDQVYMQAVQMIWGQGGWPLNVFALPDGRPFYGGTYFRNQQWKDTLAQIIDIHQNRPAEIETQAEEIMKGLLKQDIFNKTQSKNNIDNLNKALTTWMPHFDYKAGGMKGAPKFPMPVQHEFLLRYYYHTRMPDLKDFVLLSLGKMARGGIYDQLGGGFARYSTDALWKVPHFEKMLYDNAQLIRLYTEAWQITKDNLYKSVVFETIDFILTELCSAEGGFYSALDADSEGEEGKYYVWTEDEIDLLPADDAEIFKEYYAINGDGYWEDGKNILVRSQEINNPEASISIAKSRAFLLDKRKERIAPALDDKILTSWNAMMSSALLFAAKVFQQEKWILIAQANLDLLLTKLRDNNGRLLHRYKNGMAGIPAFLEDYAFLIDACIAFPVEIDEKYLLFARELADIAIADFYDTESSLFWFTSGKDKTVIARKIEITDNVIPSSNSVMARNLYALGLLFEKVEYRNISEKMVTAITLLINNNLAYHSNWGIASLDQQLPFYTLVLTGESTDNSINELYQQYLPNIIIAKAGTSSEIPLLKTLETSDEMQFHLCTATECLLPKSSLEEILALITK